MNSSGQIRIAVGVTILIAMAVYDLQKNGRDATRWREYLFLALGVAIAIVYGIINDQITSRISWEYFYFGKELDKVLGPQIPPDPGALHIQTLRIGAEATWWTGLIIAAALLVANNPIPGIARLSYRKLIWQFPEILTITFFAALFGGLCGYLYLLNWISPDFREMAETNEMHPHQFLLVYGIHLGGYFGGLVGTIIGFIQIRRTKAQRVIRQRV